MGCPSRSGYHLDVLIAKSPSRKGGVPLHEKAGAVKSTIVQTMPAETRANYSELQVLRSNAGWYVGTLYTDPETGLTEPGSRDSGYYPNQAEAQKALSLLVTLGGDTAAKLTRQRP